jgi:hypothetical protein
MVPDKLLIKVGKVKEDLNIPIGLRLRPFLNSFYAGRVYYNIIKYDNKA